MLNACSLAIEVGEMFFKTKNNFKNLFKGLLSSVEEFESVYNDAGMKLSDEDIKKNF